MLTGLGYRESICSQCLVVLVSDQKSYLALISLFSGN